MARIKCHSRKMSKEWLHFMLLFHTIQQYFQFTVAVESHNQAFIQTDNHLTYIGGSRENGIPLEVNPGQLREDLDSSEEILLKKYIRLEPPWLDFFDQPVGMPRMEHVLVLNSDPKNSLHLLSISGSTLHFHCSFFQEKIVPPGGNTTFDIVFLARQEGNVENTLYIHTSQGSFTYPVFGVGIPNPYRLRPFLGAKVPLNSSFSPLIEIHNPHSSTLQVTEMFSSEGDLHLELPTGDLEAPKRYWEIPPYETKPVMKANFIGRKENNHTAFIRIKTNKEEDKDLLILPLEIEVSSAPGIYSPVEMLDFGILRTLDDPKTVRLRLVNTGARPVHISSVVVSPPNDAINLEFRPVKLQSDLMRHTTVAHITFNAAKALNPKQWSGKIIIKSKNSQYKTVIPYQASVLHGSLVYNLNNTYFFSAKDVWNYTRSMVFTNTFNFSIVIYNITLPAHVRQYFSILNFTKPIIIQPQKRLAPFLLKFHPNTTQLHFTTWLTLHTNASTFTLPIVVYNGLLKVIPHRPEREKNRLDFGTMGVSESRSMTFTLRNDNPVDVHIGEITPDLEGAFVQFLGMEKGNGTLLSRFHNTTEIDYKKLVIKPYHFVVFSLNLTAPDIEGNFSTEMLITTQFEDIWMPVSLRTADGSLTPIPEIIIFDRVYPGKIAYKVLQIYSTFRDFMEVTGVSFQPPDPRFYYRATGKGSNVLEPVQTSVVGKIYFDSKKECQDDCYVGLSTSTHAGHQWLLGLGLEKEVADIDQYVFTRLQQKWEKLEKSEQNIINVTVEMDTSEVRGFLFSAQAYLHWPSLVRKCKIKFPLTQIGNISISDFIVENPGDVPVLIQILPLPLYPNPQTIIEMLSHRLSSDLSELIETDDLDIFTLPDLEHYNPSPQNPVPGFRKHIESTLGVKPHKHTITTVLQPGVKVKVRVGFQPKDDISKTSIILIRNNLTIVDTIVVQGQGGRGEMKLSNKKPGSAIPLQFDMTEKHLKNCDKKKFNKNMVPNFTVRRSFTLKNTGELPFYVHGYSINDASCEGYGFRVLDCDGFEMLANTSRKIDIAFTPDFTMSRIRRVLTVFTSLGLQGNYTLQATVPPHTLSRCSAALPRPNWEPVLYYSITCVMGFLLFCILVAAYFEADRIFVADIIRRKVKNSCATQTFDKGKVFDLKQVAGITSPQQVKPTLHSPSIPMKPSPVIQVANGHIEHNHRKESFVLTLLNFIRSFFSWKSSRTPVKSKVDRQESRENDGNTNQPNRISTDKEKRSLPQETSVSEKSIIPQRVKKAKAAKRSHSNDLTHVTEINSLTGHNHNNNNKKTGNREANSHDIKKTTDVKQQTNLSSDKTNKQKLDTTSAADSLWALENEDAKIDSQPAGESKYKGKKRTKSKQDRDLVQTTRYIPRSSVDNDKDETSSTTTESSVGDDNDKSSSARESTPEPPPTIKAKKLKSKARTVEAVGHYDDTYDDNDFELTSKSKAHKKIKVNSKDAYGGNILRPSTLELPYSLETKQDKDKKEKSMLENSAKLKKSSKSKNRPTGQLFISTVNTATADTVDSTELLSDQCQDYSPTPAWDQPSPDLPLPGDLSELSIQTQEFAQKQSKSVNGFSPDLLTSSSRSSSYSSIVSNSSENGTNGKNKVKTGVDNKRFPIGFSPFGDSALPAAIGTKAKSAPVGAGKSRNVWNVSPPTTPEASMNSFGLQTIQESHRSGSTSQPDSPVDVFTQPKLNFSPPHENVYNFVGGNGNAVSANQTSGNFEPAQTMMQRLQADRRKRIMEHQMRMMNGEDWPGFDVPPVRSDSLWDSEYNPLDPVNKWSQMGGAPPTSSSESLWSSLANSANSSWNSLMSIWGSNTPMTTGAETMTTDSGFNVENGDNTSGNAPKSPEQLGTFNPFNSMADIWGPNAPTTSSGWTFPTTKTDDN